MAQKTPYINFHSLNLDWIIKRIKNVYNDENPPPYPVRSVNGQTGTVHLTGDDIPVSPNNTTPVSTELAEKYTKPASGIPASDLAPGVIPDPVEIIDDNAGARVYDKTWSAHKLFQMLADILDLQNDKVDDVQINGDSIVEQGVADIPLLSANTPGVATVNQYSYGLLQSNGNLRVAGAEVSTIKYGNNSYRPVTPVNLDAAVFYGLSKVAGYDLADVQTTLGTYSQESKNAILALLGIYTSILSPSGNTHTLLPCPFTYAFGEKSELTVTVTATTEYYFSFSSPAGTACNLTINGITGTAGDEVEAGKYYEVSVWNGIAMIRNVEVTVG